MKQQVARSVPAQAEAAVVDAARVRSAGIANSTYLGMIDGGESTRGAAAMESAMSARLAGVRMQKQIPHAESEADRLAGGVNASGPEEVKEEMGRRMGADFSAVRFHTDRASQSFSDHIGARAYTTGSDVYFGEGGFDPQVAAHELVHTAQQGAVSSEAGVSSTPMGGVQMIPKWLSSIGSGIATGARAVGHGIATGAKAVGHGIATGAKAVGHGAAVVGRGLKRTFINPFASAVRSHHRAVDQLNDNYGDFQKMSFREKAKFVAKNPLAFMLQNAEKGGTAKRNAGRAEREAKVNALKASGTYSAAGTDASFNIRDALAMEGSTVPPPSAPALDAPTPHTVGQDMGELAGNTAEGAGSLGGHFSTAGDIAGAVMPNQNFRSFTQGRSITDAPSDVARGLGGTGAVLGTIGGVNSMIGDAKDAYDAFKAGKKGEGTLKIGDLVSDTIGTGGSLSNFSAAIDPALKGASTVGAAAGVVTGGWQAAKGVGNMVAGTYRRSQMANEREKIEAKAGAGDMDKASILSRLTDADDKRNFKMLHQAKRQQRIRQVQGGFDTVAGGLGVAGGVATLSGAAAPVGLALGGAAALTSMAGSAVTKDMRKNMTSSTVNEELGLDEKIKAFKSQPGNEKYSDKEAKHMILRAMGFSTGKRKEAFEHITMSRAMGIAKQAQSTDATKKAEAEAILKSMGVSAGAGGGYSIQEIGQALGMEKGKDWKQQMYETQQSRAKNVFADRAKQQQERETTAKSARGGKSRWWDKF